MKKRLVNIDSPFSGGRVWEVSDVEERDFRKERYSVHVRYYLCEDTGEQFTTKEQDSLWVNELYGQWRVRHGVPFPDEIKSIRLKYGLNYSQISKIMGFGINQWKQYEDGLMPSESNGKMIKSIGSKNTMLILLDSSKGEFSESEYEKLQQQIKCVEEDVTVSDFYTRLVYGDEGGASIYNGYGAKNVNKVSAMVRLLLSKCGGVAPIKLGSMMFYSDFYHYRRVGRSISGLKYRALKYGPSPRKCDTILDNIEGVIKEVTLTDNGVNTVLYSSELSGERDVLERCELETLEAIAAEFGNMTTSEVITIGQDDISWIEEEQDCEISYSYAFDLKGI